MSAAAGQPTSSTNVVARWVRALNNGVWGSFYVLTKKMKAYTKLAVLSQVINLAQMLAFLSSNNLAWSSLPSVVWLRWASNIINVQGYLFLESAAVYLTIFYAAVAFVALFVGLFAYCMYAFITSHFPVLWPIKLLSAIGSLAASELYIPLMSTLLENFQCRHSNDRPVSYWQQQGYVCYEGGHLAQTVITVLLLVGLISLAMEFALLFFDPFILSRSVSARSHGRSDFLFLLMKTVLVIFVQSFPDTVGPWGVISVLLTCSVIWLTFTLYFMASMSHLQNRLNAAGAMVFFFGSICVILCQSIGIDGGVLLAVTAPLAAMGGVAMADWRAQDIHNKTSQRLRNAIEVDLKVRYLLHSLLYGHHTDKLHTISEAMAASRAKKGTETDTQDDEEARMLESTYLDPDDVGTQIAAARQVLTKDHLSSIEEIYRTGCQRFKSSSFLHVAIARFYSTLHPNRHMEMSHLMQAERCSPLFDVGYMIFQARKKQEDVSGSQGQMSALTRVAFEKHLADARRYTLKAIQQQVAFWNELGAPVVDLTRMHGIASQMTEAEQRAEASFTELLALNSQSLLVIRLYAEFTLRVRNNSEKATLLVADAERIEEATAKERTREAGTLVRMMAESPLDIMSDATGMITVSGNPQSLGTITSANGIACRVLGYSRWQLERRNVNCIVPAPMQEAHDSFLRRYLSSGEGVVVDYTRCLLAMHKSGCILQLLVTVRETMTIDGSTEFVGLLRPLATTEQHIILDDKFNITAATQTSCTVLDIDPQTLRQRAVSLLEWIPELYDALPLLRNDKTTTPLCFDLAHARQVQLDCEGNRDQRWQSVGGDDTQAGERQSRGVGLRHSRTQHPGDPFPDRRGSDERHRLPRSPIVLARPRTESVSDGDDVVKVNASLQEITLRTGLKFYVFYWTRQAQRIGHTASRRTGGGSSAAVDASVSPTAAASTLGHLKRSSLGDAEPSSGPTRAHGRRHGAQGSPKASRGASRSPAAGPGQVSPAFRSDQGSGSLMGAGMGLANIPGLLPDDSTQAQGLLTEGGSVERAQLIPRGLRGDASIEPPPAIIPVAPDPSVANEDGKSRSAACSPPSGIPQSSDGGSLSSFSSETASSRRLITRLRRLVDEGDAALLPSLLHLRNAGVSVMLGALLLAIVAVIVSGTLYTTYANNVQMVDSATSVLEAGLRMGQAVREMAIAHAGYIHLSEEELLNYHTELVAQTHRFDALRSSMYAYAKTAGRTGMYDGVFFNSTNFYVDARTHVLYSEDSVISLSEALLGYVAQAQAAAALAPANVSTDIPSVAYILKATLPHSSIHTALNNSQLAWLHVSLDSRTTVSTLLTAIYATLAALQLIVGIAILVPVLRFVDKAKDEVMRHFATMPVAVINELRSKAGRDLRHFSQADDDEEDGHSDSSDDDGHRGDEPSGEDNQGQHESDALSPGGEQLSDTDQRSKRRALASPGFSTTDPREVESLGPRSLASSSRASVRSRNSSSRAALPGSKYKKSCWSFFWLLVKFFGPLLVILGFIIALYVAAIEALDLTLSASSVAYASSQRGVLIMDAQSSLRKALRTAGTRAQIAPYVSTVVDASTGVDYFHRLLSFGSVPPAYETVPAALAGTGSSWMLDAGDNARITSLMFGDMCKQLWAEDTAAFPAPVVNASIAEMLHEDTIVAEFGASLEQCNTALGGVMQRSGFHGALLEFLKQTRRVNELRAAADLDSSGNGVYYARATNGSIIRVPYSAMATFADTTVKGLEVCGFQYLPRASFLFATAFQEAAVTSVRQFVLGQSIACTVCVVLFVAFVVFYFVPSIIAENRAIRQQRAILLLLPPDMFRSSHALQRLVAGIMRTSAASSGSDPASRSGLSSDAK